MNGFNREKLLEFLEKNPDKIPSMSKTLMAEILDKYYDNIKAMSIWESFNYIYENAGLINKKIINIARYGT
jgi:hypothetical protein